MELIRPKAAVARFRVSRQTLGEWADKQWIGRARIGGVTFYAVSDIEELIASKMSRRKILPMPVAPSTTLPDDWRDSEIWRGTSAGRAR